MINGLFAVEYELYKYHYEKFIFHRINNGVLITLYKTPLCKTDLYFNDTSKEFRMYN